MGSSLGSPGRSPALLVGLFILLPLKAGGEEGGRTRTTQSERKKKKSKLKMWSAWQSPKAQEHRDREKNVSLLSNWMEIRCRVGTSQDLQMNKGPGRKGGKIQLGWRRQSSRALIPIWLISMRLIPTGSSEPPITG